MINVNTVTGGSEVKMSGSWVEITAGVHAALESYYRAAKSHKGETYARAKIRMICSDVLAPENETGEDRIKRWTKCITEEMAGRKNG